MKFINLRIDGQIYEAFIGFDVSAYILQSARNGKLDESGEPYNPGRFAVDLLSVACPEVDWRYLAETNPTSVGSLLDAKDAILMAVAEPVADEVVAPEPEPELTMAQDPVTDEWKARMGVMRVN